MTRNNRDDEPRIWALRDRSVVAPQTSLARGMRRVPTDAEKRLWWHLRRVCLNGSHFRRQVWIGRYIVDFASHKTRVVIEVDGGQHAENAVDAVRTKFIEGQGYRVLRFWNNEVLSNIEGVLEVIQATIAANSPPSSCGEVAGGCRPNEPHCTTPTPDPSPQGGGEQKETMR
jgi:very-short-patch-repair endonuclease